MGLNVPAGLLKLAADERRWGVAVSGGGDSVALLRLCLAAGVQPKRLLILNFDHQWGVFGGQAAAYVAQLGVETGVKVRFAAAKGAGRPASNAEELAREERQAFFVQAAQEEGLAGWLTGHTRTDQVEQVLMRLGRGSGLTGLAGMRAVGACRGFEVRRPLLGYSREELRAYLRERGQDWLEDPSNGESYRGRVRALVPALAAAGIGEEALAASVRHLARAEGTLAGLNEGIIEELVTEVGGGFTLERERFLQLPWELKLRLVGEVGCRVSGEVMAPRLSKRARLVGQMHDDKGGVATLGGCKWEWDGAGVRVGREKDTIV